MDASALVLTPYRNPPYRTPTPKSSVSPPPQTDSPKRKRSDFEASAGGRLLQINTSTRDFAPVPGIESPRSKVAERLRDLQIKGLQTPTAKDGDAAAVRRKRPKRDQLPRASESGTEIEDDGFEESSSQHDGILSKSPSPAEIGETPDCRLPRWPSSPPVSPGRIRSLDGLPTPRTQDPVDEDSRIQADEQPRSLLPTDPTSLHVSPLNCSIPFIFGCSAATFTGDDTDRAALTWQDHEITGQDIDASSPDDDGLGINGIGFRPTPAIAYARSQKRRQQVSEWRAREAREARQKRIERRRGPGKGVEERGGEGRRCVRFEGEG